MKLLFVNNWNLAGGMYGFSTHVRQMKKALTAVGVEVTLDPADTFDAAVHIVGALEFKPIPGRVNILFTMAETDPPFQGYTLPIIKQATALVVPCNFCKRIFAQFYPGDINVCPEGIAPDEYPFVQRREPYQHETFRFLWVGNWDRRKGNELVQEAWNLWLHTRRMPKNVELYLKTTGMKGPELKSFKVAANGDQLRFVDEELLPAGHPALPRIVMDIRNLPGSELRKLYQSTHAFVFPSLGEGWGLGLTEAMATGCPCIWSDHTAMLDYAFADKNGEIGYPIRNLHSTLMTQQARGYWGYGQEPDLLAVVQAMEQVYYNYSEALARGKRASERMHTFFPWEQAALKFRNICRKYLEKPATVAAGAKA